MVYHLSLMVYRIPSCGIFKVAKSAPPGRQIRDPTACSAVDLSMMVYQQNPGEKVSIVIKSLPS